MTERNPSQSGAPAGFPYYRGPVAEQARIERPAAPIVVDSMPRRALEDPGRYRPHKDLEAAVNTALLLGMPLMVTGEPGCGKTQLGEAVAHALGLAHEKFETKSTSLARDLFYEFDVVGRFHAREAGLAAAEPHAFVEYRALGKAILLAHAKADVQHLLPTGRDGFHPGSPVRTVVTIDEIDKAPRDFPNDILNEIDRMYFRVPELGPAGIAGTPAATDPSRALPGQLRPVVILTSNSEKKLPDAFLRRCVYFNIPDPTPHDLREIVFARLSEYLSPEQRGVADALSFFAFVREPGQALAKRPGIAELLNWLQAMAGTGVDFEMPLAMQSDRALAALTTLFKTSEDLGRVRPGAGGMPGLFQQWAEGEQAPRA